MSVAARIEVGVGVRSGPEQGLASAKAAGKTPDAGLAGSIRLAGPAGMTGAGAANSSVTSMPALPSFRSSWQTHLESLGSGLDSLSAEEETVEDGPAAAKAALEASSGSRSTVAPARLAGLALAPIPGAARPVPRPAVLVGTGVLPAGIAPARIALPTPLQTAAKGPATSSASATEKQAAEAAT
jgi:hypothetical protein